jgi:hypothetical protein
MILNTKIYLIMKNLEKIEKFLANELEDAELWEFKKALETDVQLAKELKQYKEMKELITQKHKRDFLEAMKDVMDEEKEAPKPKKKINLFYFGAAAAAILILFAIGNITYNAFLRNQSNADLFTVYYKPDNMSLVVRSGLINSDQPVLFGLQQYELQNYTAALESFQKSPNNMMGRLYSGLSNVELGEFSLAIADFKTIIKHQDNLFIDQAEWYLALCYLKTGQSKETKKQLEIIAQGRGIYKTKAQKLLNEINK